MPVYAKLRIFRKNFPSVALGTLLLFLGTGAAWAGGNISFNYQINWKQTPALYFTLTGGPPSTCGTLISTRNGGSLVSPNYVCTDASGNSTMGPWTWAGTASDQTDDPLYVRWPDGSTTNQIWHIWDKLSPSVFLDPYSGTPPSSWSGSATDPQWGAGFSASWGSRVETYFRNVTTNRYWTPTSSGYSAAPLCNAVEPIRCLPRWVGGNLYGMPSHSVYWDTAFPPASAHTTGNGYEWKTCVYDNYTQGQSGCITVTFSM
jgi:hypothetical protein